MKDIVIPYKKNASGELEACIALIKKNVSHRKIHVVDKKFHPTSHIDQILKLKYAIETLDISDDFYLYNDDFFVMRPIDGTPYYHKGTLKQHIASRRAGGSYTNALIVTSKYLGEEALSYELHVPMLFNKTKLLDVIGNFSDKPYRTWPLIRSTYGNTISVAGTFMEDVKNPTEYIGKTYLSTTERSFHQELGDYIRSKI